MTTLVTAIVDSAALQDISQKVLAARAGIAEASLSRIKRRPSVSSIALELDAVEQQWQALRAQPATTRMLRNICHGYEQATA